MGHVYEAFGPDRPGRRKKGGRENGAIRVMFNGAAPEPCNKAHEMDQTQSMQSRGGSDPAIRT